MGDNYEAILDRWPVVQQFSGVEIVLDTDRGIFVAKIEAEHIVSSETLTGVKEKIDRAFSFKEKAKKDKLTPIPVLRVESRDPYDHETIPTLEDVNILSLHAGNGNVIIQDSRGKKEQVTWGYGHFLVPMTSGEREDYDRLVRAKIAAENAFREFEEKFRIDGSLEDFARKTWKLPKGVK